MRRFAPAFLLILGLAQMIGDVFGILPLKELAARGFKFVGPTIVYAFMQATGMVNDHLVTCFRHGTCAGNHRAPRLTAK